MLSLVNRIDSAFQIGLAISRKRFIIYQIIGIFGDPLFNLRARAKNTSVFKLPTTNNSAGSTAGESLQTDNH